MKQILKSLINKHTLVTVLCLSLLPLPTWPVVVCVGLLLGYVAWNEWNEAQRMAQMPALELDDIKSRLGKLEMRNNWR